MKELGAQAVLANAYHLYLQPGADIVDEAGGLGAFMNWPGPDVHRQRRDSRCCRWARGFARCWRWTPSGSRPTTSSPRARSGWPGSTTTASRSPRTWTDPPTGSRPRFRCGIQHQLGADIIFAFDELTTLVNTRGYQEESVQRTHDWAVRCLVEHRRLTAAHPERPPQALFGVVQGAQYEDLRRQAARGLRSIVDDDGRGFDGYGIGGALEKQNLATIVGWVSSELPADKPRHLLGISEPDDLFDAVAAGADTFDCVSPSRVARNAAVYSVTGRYNITGCPLPPRLHADRRRVRLLHLRALHPGLHAPSVQGQGDPGRDAVHHPQRALRRSGWSTRCAPRSGPASSTSCASTFWAGTTELDLPGSLTRAQ